MLFLRCERIGQVKHQTKNINAKTIHVNDVVTDCNYALAEFLYVFGAFPVQS